MKNTIYTLLTTLSLIVLTACSGGSSPVSTVPSPTNEDLLPQDTLVEVSNLKIGEFQTLPMTLDFGQVGSSRKTLKLIVKNDLSTPENIDINFSSGNGFVLSINRCPEILPPQNSCSLTLSFSKNKLYNGIYNSGIEINSNAVGMVGEVINSPDPETTGSPLLSLSFKDTTFTDLSNPLKTITLKNNGTGVSKNILIQIPSGYTMLINRCSNKLFPGESCSIKTIWKEHRTSNASDSDIMASYDNELSTAFVYKTINTLTGVESTPVISFNPLWTNPTNTKTEICSGTESITRSLISCSDSFGRSVSNDNCSMAPPSVVFNSPEGEYGPPDSITGGSLYKKCLEGSTSLVNSRVECNEPLYLPSGFTCAIQTFTADYDAAPANLVPNVCDGTQNYSRSLTPGTCRNSSTLASVADEFCAPTLSGQNLSPSGTINEPISDGYRTFSCGAGVSIENKVFNSGTCTTQYYGYEPSSSLGLCVEQIFPKGTLGALVVSGVTNLAAGVYDYDSIIIQPGGILNITGSGLMVLGSRGDIVINGTINSTRYNQGCGSYTHARTEPYQNAQTYSWTMTQSLGGNGGKGGTSIASGSYYSNGGAGGNGNCGHGGGGGGGAADNPTNNSDAGAGGSNGNPGANATGSSAGRVGGSVSTTVTRGLNGSVGTGGNGGNGGGAGGRYGGGGGGGGYKGLHSHSLVIKTKGNISGSGTINLSGGNASNGGDGGIYYITGGYARNGGGGGGGAGGNGGHLRILHKGANSFSLTSANVNGGSLGTGGAYSTAVPFTGGTVAGSNGASGTSGNIGTKSASSW